MFQIAIKNLIKTMKTLTERMEIAYNETFNDLDLTREASKAIANMRKKNKSEFVNAMATLTTQKILKEEGWLMPRPMAVAKGEKMFKEAMEKGDIDTYTYKLIEKE